VVFIDRNVRVGVPASVGDHLRVQSAGGAIYLRASESIPPTRLQLQDVESGALILLDIAAEPAKDGQAPLEPVRERAQRHIELLAQRRRRCVLPGMSDRTQHHHQPQVHAPAQKAHRHRGGSASTMAAAKAQPRLECFPDRSGTTAGFARIVGAMQNAPARRAAGRPRPRRQLFIDADQEQEKLWNGRLGVAHWEGLLAWKPETPPKGAFVQAP
jgi:hypothetical protein